MAEIELDLTAAAALAGDGGGLLEALLVAAQNKVAAERQPRPEAERVQHYGSSHSAAAVMQQGAVGDDSLAPVNSASSVISSGQGGRLEDRMEIWWARRNEKIEALRAQIEEQQRLEHAETPSSTFTARRLSKAMAESTMLERTKEWARKREAKLSDLKKQLAEAEMEGCTFRPAISAAAEFSEGLLPQYAKDALHSPRKPAFPVPVDPYALAQRQSETMEEYVARQKAARERRKEAPPQPGSHYTGAPTVPKAPQLRTEGRAARTPGGLVSPAAAGAALRGPAPMLVPGPMVGLPHGTYAPATSASSAAAAAAMQQGQGAGQGMPAPPTPASAAPYARTLARMAGTPSGGGAGQFSPGAGPSHYPQQGVGYSAPRTSAGQAGGGGMFSPEMQHALRGLAALGAPPPPPASPMPASASSYFALMAAASAGGGGGAGAAAPAIPMAAGGPSLLPGPGLGQTPAQGSVDVSSVLKGADRTLKELDAALGREEALARQPAGGGASFAAATAAGGGYSSYMAQASPAQASALGSGINGYGLGYGYSNGYSYGGVPQTPAASYSLLHLAAQQGQGQGAGEQQQEAAAGAEGLGEGGAESGAAAAAAPAPSSLPGLSARDLYSNPALLGLATLGLRL